jgi:hypothetical protein
MNTLRSLSIACVLTAACAFAQVGEYTGPAVLSRGGGGGVAPASPISFRPYVSVTASHTAGMAGAVVRPDGTLAGDDRFGAEGALGLYGYQGWKRTVVGLNYRGDYRRYAPRTFNDGSNHLLVFGLTHYPSRRVSISLRQGAGTFNRNHGYMGTFGFYDPTFAHVPQDELLDTRTSYSTSMADVTFMKSPRLSFNFGGSGFTVRRQASALYSVTGASARVDTAYRLTRRNTVGADYLFTHFGFSKAFGASDMHSVAGNYSVQISRWWHIGARAGVTRLETLSLGAVDLDPIVAAIIGRSAGYRAFYRIDLQPTFSLQLGRQFRRASAHAAYHRGATPGNGIYLTSRQNSFSAGYSYTGMRHWNLASSANYSDLEGVGQDIRAYRSAGGSAGATRMIGSRNLFLTARCDLRRSLAGHDFRRIFRTVSVGLAYSPGDVPLRLW